MAREYVKDLSELKDLGKEIEEGVKGFEDMDAGAQNVLKSVTGSFATMKDMKDLGGKFSKQNKESAKLVAEAGKAALKFAKSKSPEDKKAYESIKKRVLASETMGKEFKDQAKNIFKQTDNVKEVANLEKERYKTMMKSVDATAKIATGVAAAVGLGGGLLAMFKQYADLAGKIGAKFGALGMQSEGLRKTFMEGHVEVTKIGKSMDNLINITDELTTNFGFSMQEAAELSTSIADTALALGISDSEASQLFGTLSQIAGLSTDITTDFMKQTALLADANNVAPNAVLRDIAKSSETIAKFTGMTPDNISKAAVMAKKLGTNLDTVGKVAEGLLDFQNSLNKEIEASVILGKDLNFQKARELALNNDIEGAMKNILTQLGSEEEFNRMNYFQRKALADAIGVSVAEMAQMINKQKEARTLNDIMAGQKPLEELIGRNSMESLSKVIADFKAMGAELMISVGPAMMNIMKWAGGMVKFFGQIKAVLPLISTALLVMAGHSLLNFVLSIGTALGKSAGWLGPAGIGIVMAIPAIVAGILASVTSLAGDVFSPALGKGKTQISPREGGLYELSPNDDLMAAPGLLEFFKSLGSMIGIGDTFETSATEGGLDLIPSVPNFGAAFNNLNLASSPPPITIDEFKKAFADVMTPLSENQVSATVDNTAVNVQLKEVQEQQPRKTAAATAENIFYSRY